MNILMLSEISGTFGIKNSLIEKMHFFLFACTSTCVAFIVGVIWRKKDMRERK